VNITSVGGKLANPHLLPYTVGKFAAVGFSEGLRAEVAADGVKVTTVVPGLMRTGSHVNALFAGQSSAEYTWFSVLANMPGMSIDAGRAARRVVRATKRGETEVMFTIPAQVGARAHGLMPGFAVNFLTLLARPLPSGGSRPPQPPVRGMESENRVTRSFLTALGQRAARRYNQYVPSG
jgi:short-subunit dehydrogenase